METTSVKFKWKLSVVQGTAHLAGTAEWVMAKVEAGNLWVGSGSGSDSPAVYLQYGHDGRNLDGLLAKYDADYQGHAMFDCWPFTGLDPAAEYDGDVPMPGCNVHLSAGGRRLVRALARKALVYLKYRVRRADMAFPRTAKLKLSIVESAK
jgi:hypothetical protein